MSSIVCHGSRKRVTGKSHDRCEVEEEHVVVGELNSSENSEGDMVFMMAGDLFPAREVVISGFVFILILMVNDGSHMVLRQSYTQDVVADGHCSPQTATGGAL